MNDLRRIAILDIFETSVQFGELIYATAIEWSAVIYATLGAISFLWLWKWCRLFHPDSVHAAQLETSQCSICMEYSSSLDGVRCGAGIDGKTHFLCTGCFSKLVRSEVEKQEFRGDVFCPHHSNAAGKCPSPAYSRALIAQKVESEVFEALESKWLGLREQETIARLQQEFDEKLQKHLQASLNPQLSTRVDNARKHIEDDILTLKCPGPQCRQAFVDFEGCFALKCSRCLCHFCAWCLAECGSSADAHSHVRACPHKQNEDAYYGTEAEFKKAHRDRCTRLVREYLDSLDHSVRVRVVRVLEPDLRELGLCPESKRTFADLAAWLGALFAR